MNKQEAIKELESLKTIGNDARVACYNEGINAGITIIKRLDEPQKPVVPKFVANLVDWTIKMQCAPSDVIRDLHDNGDLANLPRDLELDKLSEYFDKAYCRYNFEKACFVGYEVEKVQKYIVKIGKLYLKEPLGDTSDSTILTTWDKKCAYPFSSFHTADKHADKFEGAVVEVAEG
ncbi:DUF1642 domain-containing protein [Enterococcus hirae]|uniref:DUF1642 domain-containing protein n=1 Tax=Enterococcus hirae TaxID=1354 RepID=UPI0006B151E3|nr:DUF1642 domain-containing protein [Enterococcus hirae]